MTDLTLISLNPCAEVLHHLHAFIDDELSGQVRLRIAEHLEGCATCAAEVQSVLDVGHAIRAAATSEASVDLRLTGLSARVVGRIRAEEPLTWRGLLAKALDGWHWTIVGAGSVMGTFATTSVLSLILAFGPTPLRDDSLSALMGNLGSPPGYLLIEVGPMNSEEITELFQVRNGMPAVSRSVAASASTTERSEADVVDELAETVTRDGRVLSLTAMDAPTRERTEALFAELSNMSLRRRPQTERTLSVKGVRLVTSVTAKS